MDGRRAAGVALALMAVMGTAAPADAARRVDVRVATLAEPPARVAVGTRLTVRYSVRRSGRRTPRAAVTLLLSKDRRRSRGDVRLGAPARIRLRRPVVHGVVRRTVPRRVRPGRYRLLVCVSASRRRGSCRASRRTLRVARAAPGAAPPPTAPPPTAPPSAPPPAPPPAPPAADPVTVRPVLAEDEQVRRLVVAREGGRVEAEGPDGTRYVLDVPPDALFSDTTITMTPVVALDGLPLSRGLVGAVKLEPEGITLNAPAVLTVEPPPGAAPVPLSEQTGFTSRGDGSSWHFAPLAFGSALRVELLHFSIPGVGRGTDADRAAAGPPAAASEQLEHAVAEGRRAARERGAPQDGDWVDGVVPRLLDHHRDVVRPAVDRALADDTHAEAALAELFAWARTVALLGLEDDPRFAPPMARLDEDVARILQLVVDAEFARCQAHDLQAIHRMLAAERAAQLLGLTFDGVDKLRRCLTFEVDVESVIDGAFRYHLRAADVSLSLASGLAVEGSGPLRWQEFSGSFTSRFHGCDEEPVTWTESALRTTDSTLRARLQMDIAPRGPGAPPRGIAPGASVVLATGSPSEVYWWDFEPQGDCVDQESEQSRWEVFFVLGASDVTKEGAVTAVGGLQTGGGELLLRRSLHRSAYAATETLALDVWHRPQP